MEKTELVHAIKDNKLSDYIAQNYWKMSKEKLKTITLQLIYTMHDNNIKETMIDTDELLNNLYMYND